MIAAAREAADDIVNDLLRFPAKEAFAILEFAKAKLNLEITLQSAVLEQFREQDRTQDEAR